MKCGKLFNNIVEINVREKKMWYAFDGGLSSPRI